MRQARDYVTAVAKEERERPIYDSPAQEAARGAPEPASLFVPPGSVPPPLPAIHPNMPALPNRNAPVGSKAIVPPVPPPK